MKHSHTYDLTDFLLFGKYRGYALQTILIQKPKYILWCLKNIDSFRMSDRAWDYAISRNKAFASFRPKTTTKSNNLIETQLLDGVEVLKHYPWKDKQQFRRRFLDYARTIAEDVVEMHPYNVIQSAPMDYQLQLQFA